MKDSKPNDDFIERIRARLGDRYEISRELFGGGMSRVFVAREIALDRQIVIKFLPPEIAAEANRDRFRREIQMAAKLSHPHIAPLLAAAEEGELLYYTMPFIAGESLKQSLEGNRRFSIGETMEILVDVADALAYAHRAGIVHRDIKPANVLREGGHAVITDFGVAKALSFAMGPASGERATTSQSTATGMSFGTPAYMAPEQIAGDTAADHRVDLYAFGLLGYELLTGKAPFQSPSPQAVMAAQLTQPPPPILDARPDCPPVLAALLTRCLEKDASRRPPSAESVLEVLRTVNAASGGTQYQGRQPNRNNMSWLLGGGVIVASAVGMIFLAAHNTNPPLPPKPAAPVVDSSLIRAQVAAAAAESALRFMRSSDSARRASDRSASRQGERIVSLLRDSIANAMQRAAAESLAKVRAEELAQAKRDDSIKQAAAASRRVFAPQINTRMLANAEAIQARLKNLGPSRRVGVSIQSGVRNPTLLAAAGVVRDSLLTRFKVTPRYINIPQDSVIQALARSRQTDSLRTWLNADMWATISTLGDGNADSTRVLISMYDFSAMNQYRQMTATTGKFPTANPIDPQVVGKLMENVLRLMESMDRSPRVEVVTIKK